MFFHQQHGCPENRNSRFSSLLFHFLSIQTSKNIYKTMIKLGYPQQKSKQKQNLNPIWERELEHPQTHCHQIATHIYSNLRKPTVNPSPPTQQPPTAATINLASIPQQKFKAKLKPTSNLSERIRVIERENRNERKRIHCRHSSKPPRRRRQSPNHHTVIVDL